MVYKRYKSDTATKLLRKANDIHFINPQIRKIDLKLFTPHLFEKDEHADAELENNILVDSSYSDNKLMKQFNYDSFADDEDISSDNSEMIFKEKKRCKLKKGHMIS